MHEFRDLFIIFKGGALLSVIWFLDKIYIRLNLLMFTGSRFYAILEDLRPLLTWSISLATLIYVIYKIVKIHKSFKDDSRIR